MPVYLVLTAESRRVKIGFTAGDARVRLAKMQTDNHERLTIFRWLEGDERTESAIQSRYAHLHLRGDWFAFCDTMMGDLGAPDVPPPAPVKYDSALRQYLSDHSIAIPAFARKIGVSTQAVHRYISGERIPHLEVMDKIEAETGGEVLPNDLYASARERVGTQQGEAA